MNDALDDILADSGDEEEEQGIINQVLDEIGIEITNKVSFHSVSPSFVAYGHYSTWEFLEEAI